MSLALFLCTSGAFCLLFPHDGDLLRIRHELSSAIDSTFEESDDFTVENMFRNYRQIIVSNAIVHNYSLESRIRRLDSTWRAQFRSFEQVQ